jgi:hypothetical protein
MVRIKMIDDIIYDYLDFILELPSASPGGVIISYSLDSINYDFLSSGGSTEVSSVFIL